MMEMVRLGKTEITVPKNGFGALPVQRVSLEDGVKLLRNAYEGGFRFFDTARAYSDSEEKLGEALADVREHIFLATKTMARDREAMAKDINTSLKNLRTDYIDLYQVHNPNLQQLEQVCAPGGALEALMEAKEQGRIRHLGLTAHSLEVFEKALELPWVETIMFPYNLVETQGEALMARAAEKGIAVIAMKPLAGGAIEDGRLALRYIRQNPNVTVLIPGMYCPDEVRQNVEAVSDASPLSDEEKARIEEIRQQLGTNFCRRCNYCAPCTVGISIPNVFLFQGYLRRYGLGDWARDRYSAMAVKAGDCVECGACEERCPYHLPIREMLKAAAKDFGA